MVFVGMENSFGNYNFFCGGIGIRVLYHIFGNWKITFAKTNNNKLVILTIITNQLNVLTVLGVPVEPLKTLVKDLQLCLFLLESQSSFAFSLHFIHNQDRSAVFHTSKIFLWKNTLKQVMCMQDRI